MSLSVLSILAALTAVPAAARIFLVGPRKALRRPDTGLPDVGALEAGRRSPASSKS